MLVSREGQQSTPVLGFLLRGWPRCIRAPITVLSWSLPGSGLSGRVQLCLHFWLRRAGAQEWV